MFNWWPKRTELKLRATRVYDEVVTAARDPAFYRDMGVPDTFEGRYEMIVAHLVLVLERLKAEGDETAEQARALIEHFITDMDDCMREIGVGDLTVPKKVRKAAAGLYERAEAYRAALAQDGDEALAAAVQEAVHRGGAPTDASRLIAARLRARAATLRQKTIADVLAL
ncbi:MAG: ubiquinol-cytochrome C chaperone family protein [Hyphomicrobiaceae bacterium]|nr:ubiquinol-cytochrome C chaperone family protein [Hyphomicrobiaceae bacterium]